MAFIAVNIWKYVSVMKEFLADLNVAAIGPWTWKKLDSIYAGRIVTIFGWANLKGRLL